MPAGLARYSDFWSHSLLPELRLHERLRTRPSGTTLSAAIGTILIGLVIIGLFSLVRLVRRRPAAADELDGPAAAASTP